MVPLKKIFHKNHVNRLTILKRVYHPLKCSGAKAQRELGRIFGFLSCVLSAVVMALRLSVC